MFSGNQSDRNGGLIAQSMCLIRRAMMGRMDPTRAILAVIAVGGFLVAGQFHRIAQADQRYPAAPGSVAPNRGNGLTAMDTAAREGK